MTLVSGDITLGEMTLGRLDRKPALREVAAYESRTAGGILRGNARKHLLFDENVLQFTIFRLHYM